MGGTNPDTLFGATITVSWEPAKWIHAPLVVSRTFRIYPHGLDIHTARVTRPLPTALSFESSLGFPLCVPQHTSVLRGARAYPGHKPHNGADGL